MDTTRTTRAHATIGKRAGYLLAMLAAACSAPLSAGSWQNNQAIGGFNKVHLYTPDTVSPIGNGRSLLIVLHGCTQSIDAFKTAKLEAAAEEFGMVVAVPDAMNKAGFGCWSYFQGAQTRTTGDYRNLIDLANTLSANTSRGIDPAQVYVAGLSSGAAFANTSACLAPDVFAGVGVSAGPSILTSSNGAIGPCETADVESRCRNLAGGFANHFDTQIASIAQGDADTTVNLCYNTQNAEGMAALYGASPLPGSFAIAEGAGHTAEEFRWQDGRVSMLWLNGLAHAWSGGAGASGSFIGSQSINYARYLGQFFAQNNRRVDRNALPTLSQVAALAFGASIQVSGVAHDDDGTVSAVEVLVNGVTGTGAAAFSASVDDSGVFQASSAPLADDLYTVAVSAIDDDGAESAPSVLTVRVGPEPPPAPPVLDGIAVSLDGQCATVSGQVVDANQNLAEVSISFATTVVAAQVDGTHYSAQACDLPGGANSAIVDAVDASGLSASDRIDFVIDAGQTATLQQHIDAGRLDFTNYANCYLEYGAATAFKLDEHPASGGQCQWRDADGSCAGPQVACSAGGGSTPPPPPPPASDCTAISTLNYYHKLAGRAFSTGNLFAPDYFANGSNESMPGSTYGTTSLYSNDGGNVWHVGGCP
jgi:poly(hydroxyalkanoate) depolymerase family esterase